MKITDEMLKTYIRYNNQCTQEIDEHDQNLFVKLDSIKGKLTQEEDTIVKKVYYKLQRSGEPTLPIFGLGLMLFIPTVLTLIFCRGVETIDWTYLKMFGIASILILALATRMYISNKNTRAQLNRCTKEIQEEDRLNNVPTYGFSVYEGEGVPAVKGHYTTPMASFNAALTLAILRFEKNGEGISRMDVEHYNNAVICMKAQITTTSGKEVIIDISENH